MAPPPTADAAESLDLSEDRLATMFTERYGSTVRYCAAYGRWFLYTDGVFLEDSITRVFDMARQVARDAVDAAGLKRSATRAQSVLSAKTIAAIVRLASCDPVHAIAPAHMNPDPMLLCVPGGFFVDLRTGDLKPATSAVVHTMRAAATPGGDCPTWKRILSEQTAQDVETMAYLRRLAGYCLTGSIREHIIVFFHGSGGTGKSTFLRTLAYVLGGYARSANISTFTERQNESHSTEIARLAGARMVVATETEAGKRLAAARIKELSSGERQSARFMRQDEFEFDPQFKLLLAGNHRPRLAGADDGIRRRLHVVQFNQKPASIDHHLADRLKAEAAGILAWAIEGCLEWQRIGLCPPSSVLAAASEYVGGEDLMGQWLADRVTEDPTSWTSSAKLFASWSEWAIARGEKPLSSRALSDYLVDRGAKMHRRPNGRGFLGVRINTPMFDGE